MFGRTSIRFLVSNALSLLGNSIAAVALPLILLATTGDALAAGTLALICAVPQMAIGIVGGAALDRFNRRTISIASDLVSAASIALIPIVDMIWGLNFWWFVALGLLASSLAYAAFAPRLSRRTWYVLSMFGMLLGVAILGALPAYPLMLLGALVLGVSAGPASALLGFFMLDRIPEASRGSALGTQNSLLLAAAPVAVFATSVGVSALGTSVAAVVLVGCWMAITAFALVARGMRNLDDAAPDLKREEGALEEARLDS